MTKIALIKRFGLAILSVALSIFCFAQPENNRRYNHEYIISAVEPRSAIIKINGKVCNLGSTFNGNDTIIIPSNAVIRVKELGTDKHSDIKGGNLLKLPVKTFDTYKQLNTKGYKSIETIRNYLNRGNWLMISDTAYINFPAELDTSEFFIFKSVPELIKFMPSFNYDNREITITKSDLINLGIYNEKESILQFIIEVHNSSESLFVTDSLKIELISTK